MQIIKNLQSDFHMQFSALKVLQLVTKTYASTFFADMIAFYLSLQFITHSSLSATNLVICHAEHVIIMNKNFLHVCHMNFLLEAADTNSDQENMLWAKKIISYYSHDKETAELSMTQKNKINIILIIQDLEYVIYHIDLSQQFIKEDEQ